MSLLKVTLISGRFASTSAAPASGAVFATTGGTDASVTSSARAAAPISPQAKAREKHASRFMSRLLFDFAERGDQWLAAHGLAITHDDDREFIASRCSGPASNMSLASYPATA
jgi:hypothetical protein